MQDCPTYDRADSSVKALADSWVLNIGSLQSCNVDKKKLREWTDKQKQLFDKDK